MNKAPVCYNLSSKPVKCWLVGRSVAIHDTQCLILKSHKPYFSQLFLCSLDVLSTSFHTDKKTNLRHYSSGEESELEQNAKSPNPNGEQNVDSSAFLPNSSPIGCIRS